jgi:hypothetical protein
MFTFRLESCIVVLDDFFLAANSKDHCQDAPNCLIHLLRSFGFRINWSKVIGPSHDIVFLGVRINMVENKLSLDALKLTAVVALLDHHIVSTRLSRAQLETLAGKLSWASNVVVWGRTHMCNIYAALACLKQRPHKVHITSFKQDLIWWRQILACGHNS